MNSIVEYINDLVEEGYTREEACIIARTEDSKRKKALIANKTKLADIRDAQTGKAHYAYATCAHPKYY